MLLVEEQRFSILPEWVLDLEVSDAAIRLYAVLLRYGGSSGSRMPSRRTLAERLHRSVDSIDRAMRELESAHVVRVEHRRHGLENLTNRYHLRTSDPAISSGAGERVAADLRLPLAAPLRRPWPQICGPTQRFLPKHLLPLPPHDGPPAAARAEVAVDSNARLLAECGIADLEALAERCTEARRVPRSAGHPLGRPVPARRHPGRRQSPTLATGPGRAGTYRHRRRPGEPVPDAPGRSWPLVGPPDERGAFHDDVDVGLVELEERLAATDGRRVALQAQARRRAPKPRAAGDSTDGRPTGVPDPRSAGHCMSAGSITDHPRRCRTHRAHRSGRTRRITIAYDEDEFTAVRAAATAAGLTPTGYVAEAAVAAATDQRPTDG